VPRVRVITDSTSDLSPELIQKYGVTVVPYVVNFESDSFQDGVDISTPKLFEMVARRGMLPKTSAPSLGHFRRVFEEALKDSDEVVYIGISSKFSSGTPTASSLRPTFRMGRLQSSTRPTFPPVSASRCFSHASWRRPARRLAI